MHLVDLIEKAPRCSFQAPKGARGVHGSDDKGCMSLTGRKFGYRQNRGHYWVIGPGPIKARTTIGQDASSVEAAERSIGGLICLRTRLRQTSVIFKKMTLYS